MSETRAWKLMLLVNPTAAGVNPRHCKAVQEALADHDVTMVETEKRDHATELSRQAAADDFDAVVVLGGDGTLNEAANGLVGTETAIAALPGGSTSVYARTVGMSRRPVKAALQLCQALADGSIRRVGTGNVNGRHFLFHLGVGYDAAVVGRVEGYGQMKRKLGQSVFVFAAFATWFKHYDRSRPRFQVEFDDGEVVPDGYFGICLNTNPYTYLGALALDVAPGAIGATGFTMVTLRRLKVGTLLGVMSRALSKRRQVAGHRRVSYRPDQARIRIVGNGPVPYQVDGDFLGEADELVVVHQPHSLRLLAPTGEPAPEPS